MKRRRLLIGLGGLAGAGTAFGSGAFSSISANRDVTVNVADDNQALLKLDASGSANGQAFAEDPQNNNGLLALDFSSTSAGGQGVGTDSVYKFDDVFTVTNQGTRPVYVWATFSGGSGKFTPSGSDTDIWFYPGSDSGTKLRDSNDSVIQLDMGETVRMGVHVNTEAVTQDQDLTATIHANAQQPGGSTSVDPPTQTQSVLVAENGGDYSSLHAAVAGEDIWSLEEIRIEDGIYDSGYDTSIDLQDPSGLRIVGQGSSETTIVGSLDVDVSQPSGQGLTVEGLFLDGNRFNPGFLSYDDYSGIEVTGSGVSGLYNLTFDDLHVRGYQLQQIEISKDAENLRLQNSLLEGGLQNGLQIDGQVVNSRIYNTKIDVEKFAISANAIENFTIENCELLSSSFYSYSALEVSNPTPTLGTQSRILETILQGGDECIRIDSDRANLLVEDSNIVDYNKYGIKYGGTTTGDVEVSDSHIDSNASTKIAPTLNVETTDLRSNSYAGAGTE